MQVFQISMKFLLQVGFWHQKNNVKLLEVTCQCKNYIQECNPDFLLICVIIIIIIHGLLKKSRLAADGWIAHNFTIEYLHTYKYKIQIHKQII